jgi:hypothetical protein
MWYNRLKKEKRMKSPEEIARQDKIDNAIMELIIQSAPPEKRDQIDYDYDAIAEVRDALQYVLCHKLELMTAEEFYP